MTGTKSSSRTKTRNEDTRDAESREAVSFDPGVLDDLGPLPDIPARPGYSQRWVRVAIGSEPDARNMATRSRRGWSPRQADTIEPHLRYMAINREEFGNVIGNHDVILMERPTEIQNKVQAHERKKVDDLTAAVKHNIFREHREMGGNRTGFESPRDESQSQVERGRPNIQED